MKANPQFVLCFMNSREKLGEAIRARHNKDFFLASVVDGMCSVAAGCFVAPLGYNNQGEAVWGLRTDLRPAPIDSDLAVCVTLKLDLPG